MEKLYIDIETYCELDIAQVGLYKYANHHSFEVLLIAYAFDDSDVKYLDVTKNEDCSQLVQWLEDPNIIKIAHNAEFERICLDRYFKITSQSWQDSAILAAYNGLPRSLAGVGEVLLQSNPDKKKLAVGKSLIRYFCSLVKPTKSNGGRDRNLPHHDPDKWQLFIEYCKQDVIAMREIYNILVNSSSQPQFEQEVLKVDRIINENGVLVDRQLVDNILSFYEIYQQKLIKTAKKISGIDNPKSKAQVKAWLATKGQVIESLTKDTTAELIVAIDDKEVKQFLEISLELSKSSVAKYNALVDHLDTDNRVRGLFMYYGASRTGRWSGRGVQPQNLPKGNLNLEELVFIRDLVKNNRFDGLELCYSKPMDIISQLIRTAFIAQPKHTFIIADYASIEARVLAWLADEKWQIEVFKNDGRIYEATASQMFKIPIEQVTKGSEHRAKGKIVALACGYGGGVSVLKKMGGEKIGLSDVEMQDLIDIWHGANPNITKLWDDLEKLSKIAILNPHVVAKGAKGLMLKMIGNTLYIKLPSGRKLAYYNARVLGSGRKSKIEYDGLLQTTNQWVPISTWGGKIVENVVQAIARDCLAHAIVTLHQNGYNIRLHVHDEVVIEVKEDEAEQATEKIKELMKLQDVPWAKDINLKAEAFTSNFYRKD